MQVPFLGRAPRTKETLPDFLMWSRVTRHPLVFHELTGSQRTPGVWGVTLVFNIFPMLFIKHTISITQHITIHVMHTIHTSITTIT